MKIDNIDIHQLEFCVYECAVLDTIKKLDFFNNENELLNGYKIIENIKYRIKSVDSILKKLNKKNLPIGYESIITNIYDIAGIRIICSFIDDIYLIINYFSQNSKYEIIEIKDFINDPKASGYRGIHIIIKTSVGFNTYKESVIIEIQIRTLAMDFWATLEHKLVYKNIFENNTNILNKELVSYAGIINDLDNRMTTLKNNVMKGND